LGGIRIGITGIQRVGGGVGVDLTTVVDAIVVGVRVSRIGLVEIFLTVGQAISITIIGAGCIIR
jgi:hypothetical protein